LKPGGGINRNSNKLASKTNVLVSKGSSKNITISFFKPFTQILGDDENVDDADE
jgi:hypothetical protein